MPLETVIVSSVGLRLKTNAPAVPVSSVMAAAKFALVADPRKEVIPVLRDESPVPPFGTATTPVTLEAVPVVFWFKVGISAATKARNEGTAALPVPGPAKTTFAF